MVHSIKQIFNLNYTQYYVFGYLKFSNALESVEFRVSKMPVVCCYNLIVNLNRILTVKR